MYIGPKNFNGNVEVKYNKSDECFYLRIGSFEAYLTSSEMGEVASKGAEALEEHACPAGTKPKTRRK